jgi:sec-independent protein translocase protein TatA
MMPSGGEWLIVLLIVLLIFGGSQLPKLARSLGQAQKEFKKGAEGEPADEGSNKSSDKPQT